MYIYIYIYIYIHVYVYIYTYIYTYVMNSCIHPSIHPFIHFISGQHLSDFWKSGSVFPFSAEESRYQKESRDVDPKKNEKINKCATYLSPILLNLPKYMRSQKHARARALAYNSITTITHKLNFLPRDSCQPPSCHTKKKKTRRTCFTSASTQLERTI
jgi:hypothetical protein